MGHTTQQPTCNNETVQELALQSYRLRRGWFKRLKRRLWPPVPSYNLGGRLEEILGQIPPSARVLEVGNGGRRLRPDVINLDIGPFAEVDTIGDGKKCPLPAILLML